MDWAGARLRQGTAGNAATEDAVNMFNRMGFDTGISLPDLLDIANLIRSTIEPTLLSSLSRARTYSEFDFCSEKI